MGNGVARVALWVLVVVVLAGALATIPGAWAASSPNYKLQGFVEQPGGPNAPAVPAGVGVDLISQATHQVYSTTTSSNSGQFTFTSANTGGTLAPGWWGVYVPAQAHLNLYGCSPCYIRPQSSNPQYYFESGSALTNPPATNNPVTISGVQELPYNATIFGNVTYGGKPAGGAQVELIDPTLSGFVIANNTTATRAVNATVVGEFSLKVPWGHWVLETIIAGSPDHYSLLAANVTSSSVTINPVVGAFGVWGWVNQAGTSPPAHIPAAGNVTVFDLTNHFVYTGQIYPGGLFEFGAYPAGFTGTGAQTFDVVLSPVGWHTVWFPLTVSSASPPSNPYIVDTTPQAPPAAYTTYLNFSQGFANVSVDTNAVLGNDSVFPELANASVGQLWAQLALDWQHNTTFQASNLNAVMGWLNASGPFYPAVQAGLLVNSHAFGQPGNATVPYTFSNSSGCSGSCGLSSAASLRLHWAQSLNMSGSIPASLRNYTMFLNFRHPTNGQAFNYTFSLPSGYVLSAGATAPAQSQLLPAGPGGTWTRFTLVSKPSSSASSTATFSVVKYGNVTANVNVTVANFAFSQANVLNQSHGNYTVIVGQGENVTFSALNSSFPAGTNGTLYQWNFGDGSNASTSSATTYHTYTASRSYSGSLRVTSSGGGTSSVAFTVLVGSTPPTAVVTSNATNVTSAGGVAYTVVNWSTALSFNASKCVSTIFAGAPASGVISIASWNITAGSTVVKTANYTRSSGADPTQPVTLTMLGAGPYVTAGHVGTQSIPVTGWQYNVTLTIWDGEGHRATATLIVLVRDTEKPTPVAQVLNAQGKVVSSSGVVEGPNHKAFVQLSATNTTDPHNGSVVSYFWNVTTKANSTFSFTNRTNVSAPWKTPKPLGVWLDPQSKPYTVNLTVTDRAGNTAYTTVSLTVAINTSTRPVLAVANLTAPATMTDGSSYTIWVNVTNTVGKNSTAQNVSVRFYLLPPSGTGSQITIAGSPSSVRFYNYTSNTTVSSAPFATGTASLPYNKTVRAEISWSPARQGTFDLWANATASNEFVADYVGGGNQAHVSLTLNQNPVVQYEEYGAIGAAAVVVILALIFFWRRRTGPRPAAKASTSGRSGLERGGRRDEDEEDEDDEA